MSIHEICPIKVMAMKKSLLKQVENVSYEYKTYKEMEKHLADGTATIRYWVILEGQKLWLVEGPEPNRLRKMLPIDDPENPLGQKFKNIPQLFTT